ncbi:uncharacterized protein N7482_002653 [Penicillium canariense]|uniref:histidine kinase n=1 Tax=Penicillium canariense TaxID=189055 RepID=A0A9W9IJD7_9EURO|nr:uncharacterized protein N7482_002653 [Penicillium canariense]KAJ5176776.1 hypothetical protein N7482_002653 [Penicillium canariense]
MPRPPPDPLMHQPGHLGGKAIPYIDSNTRATAIHAQSPSDPVLTAFAQLGALRLNVQRVLISLFGPKEQHILTESTRTLSLQDDHDHSSRDGLWIGNCMMSYDRSFCKSLLNPTTSTQTPNDQVLLVPDLAQDAEFENHPDVTGYPHARFLACSPIISPKGIVIGAYTVLDDKPHPALDPGMVKFLSDMATTVMNYLDTARSKIQHLRAERMIVGIGSFLEGKGSLRNSWLKATGTLDTADAYNEDLEGHIDETQQDRQSAEQHAAQATRGLGPSSHLPMRLHQTGLKNHRPKSATNYRSRKPMHSLTETRVPVSMEHTESPPSKDGHRAQVEEAFSRGANIIRESIEVEAVVFFDANFGSRGAFVADERSDQESSGRDSHSSTSGDEGKVRCATTTQECHYSTANAEDSGKDTLRPCEILGFATSSQTSVNDQLTGDKKIAISEPFLADLLLRYPQGKIFNYFEDGSISASDTSDSNFKDFRQNGTTSSPGKRGKRYKRTRKAILRQDAETLLQLAPDARSIIFTPLWDSHKGRWYSASVAWTRSCHRVFTADDELSFMFALGNSIMAEVHRLGALFAEQAKSSLLAGLSHELRSPLHGIFGMADLLNFSVMNTLQRGFVHTISSCAFTLLGSINQLLEYASINDLRATSASAQLSGDLTQESLVHADENVHSGQIHENSHVQLDVIMEDVMETVFAGYSFSNGLQDPLEAVHNGSFFRPGPFDTPDGVQVILDIDSASDWNFSTRLGAWHVVLTNIVGNALKFTRRGYIHVSLNATPVTLADDGEVIRSQVTVTVRDSGCGISPEFLQNELFLAFSQEDSMTTGNGLGLNITQRIVLSLGGEVQVESQRGVGTEVKVSVNLDHVSGLRPQGGADNSTGSYSKVSRDCVREKSVGLLGLGSLESDRLLCSSLQTLCREWLQMKVHLVLPSQPQFALCDFYISPFESLRNDNLNIKSIVSSSTQRFAAPVIVLCPSPRIAHTLFVKSRNQRDAGVVEFISQPCGPRKLAKTFEICSRRQQQQLDLANAEGETMKEPAITSIFLDTRQAEDNISIEVMDFVSSEQSEMIENSASTDTTDSESQLDQLQVQDAFDPSHVRPTADPADRDLTLFNPDKDNHSSQAKLTLAKTVLIVDDNDINVRVLVECMKKLGCQYETASNGQEAVDFFKANSSSIGVIFMDISMPVMDGLEATRQIREFEKKFDVKTPARIIALTGIAQGYLQRDTVGSGMDMFMTKPARLKSLIPLIEGSGVLASDLAQESDRKPIKQPYSNSP